jgi:hypothetical protein
MIRVAREGYGNRQTRFSPFMMSSPVISPNSRDRDHADHQSNDKSRCYAPSGDQGKSKRARELGLGLPS